LTRLRVGVKFALLLVLTGACAAPPVLLRLLCLGAPGPAARLGVRLSVLWSRTALRIIGVRTTVEGRPRGDVFLVASNHTSYLDIWVLGSRYRSAFVAKKEIESWPLFGAIAKSSGTLFVNRESPRDLIRTSRGIAEHFDRGLALTLFAEGKATSGAEVLPFMPSLFEAAARRKIPCYAATVTYDTPGVDDPPSRTVAWWGNAPLLPHVFRLLRLPRIEARLVISEQPVVSGNRKELARRLQAEARRTFVPLRQTHPGAAAEPSRTDPRGAVSPS
jgi:1-acyl-sn-glycerol-3-phosphate acyltransferase